MGFESAHLGVDQSLAVPARRRGAVSLLLGAVLASIVMLFAATPNASALSIGLMSGDSSWQEESGWNTLQHSGITVFRKAISAAEYESPAAWAEVETMFRRSAERGITIIPYLFGRPGNGSQEFPTEAEWNPAGNKWETFVYAIVQTFGYNGTFWASNPSLPYRPVTAWQVWNEPNLSKNNPCLKWSAEGKCVEEKVQPENYARFLKRTSQAIRAAQALKSSTKPEVLFAGLISRFGMKVEEFMVNAHNVSEVGSAFDGLAVHPYSFTEGLKGVQNYVQEARNQLDGYPFGNKPLWITELGWNVEPWGDTTFPAVSEAWQAVFLHETFNWIKSVASEKNIPVLIWYILRDHPTLSAWDAHTGLLRADSTHPVRPSWEEFQVQTGAPKWAPPPPKAEQWASWSAAYTPEFADVNGDGEADIVGRYGTDVQVALSDGTKFVPKGTWLTWANGYTMQLADVNGDGKADIIGRYGNDVQVALSDGTKFVGQGTWTSWSSGYSMDVADVNNDGKADLVGRYGSDVQVGLSTGSKFNSSSAWLNWAVGYTMQLADVNGDGKADIIGRYGNDVQVAFSDGTKFVGQGTWTSWSSAYSMDFADVDGNGRVDLIGRYGANIQVAFSTGSKFEAGTNWFNDWSVEYSAKYADVDGDGRADVIGSYGDYVDVFASGGPPPLGSKKWGSWSPGYSMDFADVNGDKKADIIGRFGTDVQVAFSEGSKFNGKGTWLTWASGYTAQPADVNGDGKADVVGHYGTDVQVALSDGTEFVAKGTWLTWASGYTVQMADVNGDGKSDIVGRYGSDVQVALSDGTKFVPKGTWTSWSAAYSMEFADVNGDDKADIVGRYGSNIQAGYSTGSKFEAGVNWSSIWSTKYSAQFTDVNGDKKADIIGRYGDYVAVLESS